MKMNRQIELSERMKKSFIDATDKMNEKDKIAFYQAILDGEKETQDFILKKYKYLAVTPVENLMADNEVESLANALMKDSKGIYDEINKIIEHSGREFWLNTERINNFPLEECEGILNQARYLQDSFNSQDDINSYIDGVYGENSTTILKASIIADLIGCIDLRNELLLMFNSMVGTAYNSKAMESFIRKKIISEDRSRAKKGKTNRHYDTAIKIAANTWERYPHASLAGLSEDISAHLKMSWKDVPVAGTVEQWLKKSGLYPDIKPKNRDYKLVISEGD